MVPFQSIIFLVHGHFLRGRSQNTIVTFDRTAVSFEVDHVMHKGDLLFMMADGSLDPRLRPSFSLFGLGGSESGKPSALFCSRAGMQAQVLVCNQDLTRS